MSKVIEPFSEPFKCKQNLVDLGSSCEKQQEIWQNLKKLSNGETQLAVGSVSVGSGLGDSNWNEALNYQQIQEEITKKKAEETEEKSIEAINEMKEENKKKDLFIYGGIAILVIGVLIYELKK